MSDFDFTATYKVEGWGAGIAWRVTGYEKIPDEDEWWTGIPAYDYDRVIAHMVGDNVDYSFEICELIPIPDEDYCPECGQIGCKAYDLY